jgi:hypothetical protein
MFRIHSLSKGGAQYHHQFKEEHLVVEKYTTNPIIRALHWFHAKAIIVAYNLLKK